MNKLKTYKVEIFMGLRSGYDGEEAPIEIVYDRVLEYAEKGLGVTVTPTKFVYTGGMENGFIIGFINYPRFPRNEHDIWMDAIELAEILMKVLDQYRCTVSSFDETILLENDSI